MIATDMRRIVIFSFIALAFFVGVFALKPSVAAAASKNTKTVVTPSPTPSPTPTPTITEINSFDLFWPLTAGKTEGQSLYFLKHWKEEIRGLLIFGTPQKLDYNVLLATKRVLEAETLLRAGKIDLAKSTLAKADGKLNKAEGYLTDAKNAGASLSDVSSQVGSRLANIVKLTTWLATKKENSDVKDLLMKVSSSASLIASKL